MQLSIITVNKNNATGLQQTIDSVNTQIWQEFEHIIIDGDSTDESKKAIQSYYHHLTNSPTHQLKWVSEPDSGVYHAMNKGIQKASGEYLLFLNSGDFLADNSVLLNVFSKAHTADFLPGCCNISDQGKVIHTTCPPPFITFGHLYEHGLAHQATFIARRAFEQYGLYREDFRYNADIEFWFRTIILNGCTTETLDCVISDYNLDGISSRECNSESYKKEIKDIFSHPVLQRIVPDYDIRIKERQTMEPFIWAHSKKILNICIGIIFNFAKWIKKR